MFINSTRELVDVGTLWPIGQQVSWNNWTVFGGALTPAISSVSDTIYTYDGSLFSKFSIYIFLIIYLFIDAKYPCFDVGIMIVGNVVDREDWTVFFRRSTFRPERGKLLLKSFKNKTISIIVI